MQPARKSRKNQVRRLQEVIFKRNQEITELKEKINILESEARDFNERIEMLTADLVDSWEKIDILEQHTNLLFPLVETEIDEEARLNDQRRSLEEDSDVIELTEEEIKKLI